MNIAEYLKNARSEMKKLEAAAAAMLSTIDAGPVFLSVQASKLKKVKELLQALPSRTAKLENSFLTVEKTAVDITDLQNRLDDEADGLASVLSKLGDALERDLSNPPSAGDMALSDLARTLEEQAKRVAMALFPNAIEGLAEINRMLWNFRIISADYNRAFQQEEARMKDRLSDAQFATLRQTADRLTACFDNVNALMNQLTISRQGDAKAVQDLVDKAREELKTALKTARELDRDAFKPFRGVLEAAENLAKSINKKVDQVHVPVFPSPDNALAALNGSIAADFYDELAGVQRMALLNISSRLNTIKFGPGDDDHLLSRRFKHKVFDVFPDRIYFEVDKAFIDTIDGMKDDKGTIKAIFEKAPASLHKFKDGSYKQKQSTTGNIQVSFQEIKIDGVSTGRFRVDADIDLYRSPLRHLFGEVLVNHLTGNTTDQFRVFKLLAENSLPAIAGFNVIRLA